MGDGVDVGPGTEPAREGGGGGREAAAQLQGQEGDKAERHHGVRVLDEHTDEDGDPAQAKAEEDRETDCYERGSGAAVHAEAEERTDAEQDADRDQVADDVGEEGPEQRRDPADGQAAEPVGDAVLHVEVDVRPGREHPGQAGAHDEDSGEEVLQVVTGGAGDRAAEEIQEKDQEQCGSDDAVDHRAGVAHGLDQAAAGEDETVPEPAERPGPRLVEGAPGEGGHRAASVRVWASSPARAVRAENTSSRLGSRKESSVTERACSRNRRVISNSSLSLSTGTVSW